MNCCSSEEIVALPGAAAGLLTPAEARALAARFSKINPGMFMSFEVFKNSLGLLGAKSGDPYLAERLFAAFDLDQDGRLSRSEFIACLAVMLRGSEDARLELSFRVFDAKNIGEIHFEEFSELLLALKGANSGFAIADAEAAPDLPALFEKISDGRGVLDMTRFKNAARNSEEFLNALGLHSREAERGRAESSGPGTPQSQGPPVSPSGQVSPPRHRAARVILGPRKGLAVYFGHENWNMVLNMMIGLRLATGRSEQEFERAVSIGDFSVKDKVSILPTLGNFLDSQLSKKIETMRFVDYAPFVFRTLRAAQGITADSFLRSVGPEQLVGNLLLGNMSSLAQQSSEGKSGSYFYYTADGQFLLKTISRNEKRRLKKMLPAYSAYLEKEPASLLLRFYGLHALREKRKNGSGPRLYFVVMGNVFGDVEIARSYDLKGSWVERWAKPGSATLKDCDFLKAKEKVAIAGEKRRALLAQLTRDVNFLASQELVDYSLLLGIADNQNPEIADGLSAIPSLDGAKLYRLGLIDILTCFDLTKRAERFIKSIVYDSRGISSMSPEDYAQRFLVFMDKAFSE